MAVPVTWHIQWFSLASDLPPENLQPLSTDPSVSAHFWAPLSPPQVEIRGPGHLLSVSLRYSASGSSSRATSQCWVDCLPPPAAPSVRWHVGLILALLSLYPPSVSPIPRLARGQNTDCQLLLPCGISKRSTAPHSKLQLHWRRGCYSNAQEEADKQAKLNHKYSMLRTSYSF